MNDAEFEALIHDHYQGELQTLAGGAEQNLLRLAELRERMTPEQSSAGMRSSAASRGCRGA